jgi:hypothetical protein
MACRQIWLSPFVPNCPLHLPHKIAGEKKKKKPCKLQLHKKIKN